MAKKITKQQYENCLPYINARFRSKRATGYFDDDGKHHRIHGYQATLNGQIVAMGQQHFKAIFYEKAAAYATWEDARTAAYMFRDKCREIVKKYEEQKEQ